MATPPSQKQTVTSSFPRVSREKLGRATRQHLSVRARAKTARFVVEALWRGRHEAGFSAKKRLFRMFFHSKTAARGGVAARTTRYSPGRAVDAFLGGV